MVGVVLGSEPKFQNLAGRSRGTIGQVRCVWMKSLPLSSPPESRAWGTGPRAKKGAIVGRWGAPVETEAAINTERKSGPF